MMAAARPLPNRRPLGLALLCLTLGGASLWGQDPPAEPLEFRRLYVPQGQLKNGPRDVGVRYGPMPAADFERLVELLRTSPPEAKGTLAARIRLAAYRGRFTSENDLSGQAILEIERPQSRAARANQGDDPGALLPLHPCGLAVSNPHWPDDPPEDAVCGLDIQGQFCVLARRSGSLVFDWTLRGMREPSGGWRFNFELPLAPSSSISLDLPSHLTLRASRGVVVQSIAAEGPERRWQLTLGGQHRFWIVVAPADEARRQERGAVLRQSHTYSLSPRGLELTTQLTLDVPQEPLRHLDLSIDPPLRLLAARHGEAHVPWSVVEDPSAKTARIVLEFPEPLQGLGNVVLLGATAPIKLDEPWRLPGVRAQGVFWQEGRATLLVHKPLALERLNLSDCRQSSIEALAPPATGESIGLQFFVPEASAEVLLAHGKQRLRASLGTAIELTEDAIQGRAVSELSVSEGQLFSLQFAVPNRWNIVNVQSDPPGGIKDWSLDTPTPRKRVLDVRLAKALSPGAPLRLVISGHRLNVAAAESLTADELQLVDIPGAVADELAMSVTCPEAFQLRLTGGEELTRYDPQKLALSIASLFTKPPTGLVFRLDPKAARLALSMQRLAPHYSASIRVTATATPGPLWEAYDIQCQPQGSGLERLLVYFSRAREEAPRWRLKGEAEDQMSARRLSDEEMLGQCGRETGEMWELLLRRPRSSALTIHAIRAAPFVSETPISLIWLPGAETQESQLQVRCGAEAPVRVLNSRLRPVPPDTSAAGNLLRGVFRYLAAGDTAAADPAPITISRDNSALVQSAAVVWQSAIESRYEPSGAAHHTASWLLESTGQANFTLGLPANIEVDDAWVDEERVAARAIEKQLTIPLAAGRRYPAVTLNFRTREPPLGEMHRLAAPFPTTSLPVIASDWTVWLPSGYSLAVRDGGWRQPDQKPLSIAQRLLGPLARTDNPRFDPFSSDPWRELSRLPWQDQHARERAYEFLEQLGRTPTGAWGPMLLRIQPALESSQQTLLIDRHALAKAGITPESAAATIQAESDRARGLARLEAARLTLLVREDVLLLTTPLAAAAHREQLTPLDHAAIARVGHGGLAQTLEQAAAQQGGQPFCLVDQWLSEPLSPWHGRRAGSSESVDTPGWSVFRLSGSFTELPQVEIVRQSTIDVFAWGLFLLIATVCFRRFERPLRLALSAGVCAIAALLVPELYAPICSCACLGFLAGLGWQMAIRPAAPRMKPGPPSHSSRLSESTPTLVTGIVLLLLFLAAARAAAQEDPPEPPRSQPAVHKVFIPVDDEEQPVGDLYWVPENMYTQLERRAARLALEPQSWLLERADYRGTLNWDVAQQRLLASELRLRFDLSVFEPSLRVKLPLGRDGFTLSPPDRILIDGLELPAEWEDEGRLLCFDAVQPGSYRVELALRPDVNSFGDLSGFDLTVPPLATARLELQLPRSSPAVDVSSAAGSVQLIDEGRRLVAQMGRSNRLSVRWRDGAAPSSVRTTLDTDQLVWLKVQPGAVVVEARWKFKVLEGSIRQVQIALDPRLQLQAPLEARNPLVAQTRVVAGNPQVVHVELARPVIDQFTLDASLRWSGVSGVGNLRAPLVEAQQVRTLRRLLGVSLDPHLDHLEAAGEGRTAIPPAEFVQRWGGMEAPPLLAYSLAEDAAPWSLAVRPKPVKRSVDSILAVSLSAGRSTWRYDAALAIDGSCFEHRLLTPPTLTVESVEVREEGVSRLSHWSRDADGVLTLFLAEPASGPQQIVLHGWTALPQRGPSWRLASVQLEDAEQRSAQVRVYRQPSIAVVVRNRNGLIEQTELQRQIESQLFESDRRYVALGRLASLMKADSPAYSATLLISANQPRFECHQVTTLERESGVWQAKLDCRVNVLAGLVDALRFEIPASWQAPFVLTPAADYSVVAAGEGRQLVVRPVAAISGESQIRIRGNLVPPAGGRLSLPAIALLGAERLERLLVAPSQIDLQTVSWETRGLSRIEPPAGWTGSPGLAAPEAYLVVDDGFSATLQPAVRTPGQPQVTLADISLSWQAEGHAQGVASFDLEPAGNRECPLTLPAGYRLVQVRVGGLPALAVAEGEQQWRLTLGSDELPQRVEVVYSGTLPQSAWGRQRLLAPSLGDLPVERTLWTVQGPKGSELVDALLSRRVTPWRQELFRMQSIAALTTLAQDLAANETVPDLAAWHEPWARRFRQSREALDREDVLSRDADSAGGVVAEVRLLDQQQERFAREVLGGGPTARPVSAELAADQPRQFWQFARGTPQPPLRAMLSGRSDEIEVHGGAAVGSDWPRRLLTAAGLAALVAGMLALARSRFWPGLVRGRYLAGVAFGLAWWLWLAPSIVGCLIALLVVAAAVRDRAPPPREPASAVVRLGTGGG